MYYFYDNKSDLISEIQKKFNELGLSIKQKCIRKNTVFLVLENNILKEVTIGVVDVRYQSDGFSLKFELEKDFPKKINCPTYLLSYLTYTDNKNSLKWRNAVKKYWDSQYNIRKNKEKIKNLKVGDTIDEFSVVEIIGKLLKIVDKNGTPFFIKTSELAKLI